MQTTKQKHMRNHRAKLKATGKRMNIWLDTETARRLSALAERKGWLNSTGVNAGKPSIQESVLRVVKAGLQQLESEAAHG